MSRVSIAAPLPARVERWSSGQRTLVRLLRAGLGAAAETPAEIWPAGLEAGAFVAGVRRHRIAPFLRRNLPREVFLALPEPVQRALDNDARRVAREALGHVAGLVQIVRLLAAQGIGATSIKGPLMARELHGDFAGRESKDLDVMIPEAHAAAADAALRAAGYRRIRPAPELTARQTRAFRRAWPEFEYAAPDGAFSVELIWRLSNHARFHRGLLAAPLRTIDVAGQPVTVLAPDEQALYLLLHGAFHGWLRHFWLIDIAQLMRKGELAWPALLEKARARQIDRSFWQGVQLAHEVLGAPWPAGLPKSPRSRAFARVVAGGYRHMEMSVEAYRFGGAHVWMARYQWDVQPNWGARYAELRQRWVNPADWEMLRLPDAMFPLYYVLWPLLWLARHFTKR